jgi:hypothetical protein
MAREFRRITNAPSPRSESRRPDRDLAGSGGALAGNGDDKEEKFFLDERGKGLQKEAGEIIPARLAFVGQAEQWVGLLASFGENYCL